VKIVATVDEYFFKIVSAVWSQLIIRKYDIMKACKEVCIQSEIMIQG
jgi:hypothetical protein